MTARIGSTEMQRAVESLSSCRQARRLFQIGSGTLSDLIEHKLEGVLHEADGNLSILR